MTKIYNGFRFKDAGLPAIHRMLMDWRAHLEPLHNADLANVVVDLAITLHDRIACAGLPGVNTAANPVRDAPMLYAMGLVTSMQDRVRSMGMHNPMVDYQFDVSLLPHGDLVYGIVYTEQGDWLDMWMSHPGIEPYAYWSNDDSRPDGVSSEDWQHRARVWDAIMGAHASATPAMVGLNASCTQDHMWPTRQDFQAAMPSYAGRVDAMAGHMVESDVRAWQALPENRGRPVQEWRDSLQGVMALQAARDLVYARLDPDLDLDDLYENAITARPVNPAI